MSCSYQISEELRIDVCPVDGINLATGYDTDNMIYLTKHECMRLANSLIYFYKTHYVMNDDGSPIEPLTDCEIKEVIGDLFDSHGD